MVFFIQQPILGFLGPDFFMELLPYLNLKLKKLVWRNVFEVRPLFSETSLSLQLTRKDEFFIS